MATRCGSCGKVTFPPRHVCPICHRRSMGKIGPPRLSGKEQALYSFSLVHDAPAALELQKPYIVAMIKMDEGVMMTAQLSDCEYADVKIGMRVKATLRKIGEEGPGESSITGTSSCRSDRLGLLALYTSGSGE